MSNNYYNTLGVSKSATKEEIKKAYRKKAMQYHPDRNAGDKTAEKKFKEVNNAYDILGDTKKKQQYDTFGSAGGNPFGGGAGGSGGGYSSQGFGGFEDIFGGNGGGSTTFNIEDLFGSQGGRTQQTKKQKPVNLDFEKIYEVPIFDLILGCKIEVKGVYGQTVKLKIPPSTKPGTKFRVKGLGKKEPGKEGNLIVIAKALMPKNISEVDMSMLERIRENIGY